MTTVTVAGKSLAKPVSSPSSEDVNGEQGQLILVAVPQIKAAVAALKAADPYEEPAYAVYRLEDF